MLGFPYIFINSITRALTLARSYGRDRARPEFGLYTRPLHQSTAAGDVRDLLAMLHGGAAVDERDERGRFPLHAAVECGEPGMVRVLIDAGAGLEVRDKSGQTPLFWAAYMGRTGILRLLMEPGAQLETRGDAGFTW